MNNREILSMLNQIRNNCLNSSATPEDFVDGTPVVSFNTVCDLINNAEREVILKTSQTPIKKFLFVEDGTVDTDELEEILESRNPEIKVIVYRQGGRPPELQEVMEK